ncbi:sensor histidine kinase [Aliidiomarina maris]|uniref:histidine kinase n=1 Tax=Aliidiomarina maris TaxID=531312 RepID=A0A327WSH7_9GAMM|nr:ATP-binding protein [Aliidiomarina maris]RAJ95393.1 signal transduction histidine kinase [Aliidiomarina maris]RUO22718.1 ATP-binding protein [Aliidiomarina maris]
MVPFNRISRKLLTRVLSVYFVITLLITSLHIAAEYFNTKRYIVSELAQQQYTVGGSLTRSLWEFNDPNTTAIVEGLINMPSVGGVLVRDDQGQVIIQRGTTFDPESLPMRNEVVSLPEINGVFGHYSPLVFEFSGQSTRVGDVAIFSNREVAIERLKVSLLFLVVNAIVKSTLLILLFSFAFQRLLNRPFRQLSQQIENFHLDDLEHSRLHLKGQHNNEFTQVEDAYNQLIDNLQAHQAELKFTEQQLRQVNQQLDSQNNLLEQEVARKTSRLSHLMMDLQSRRHELEQRQYKLEQEIRQRKLTESTLKRTNQRLKESLETLQRAQSQLVESEKLASLGGLVAGITHDINTPIGIGVTASSFLADRVEQLAIALEDKSLTQSQLQQFIRDSRESTQLLDGNLNRARDLIESFKQVAVDQTSEALRDICVLEYIEGVVQSLRPKLRHSGHQVVVECEPNIRVRCLAGSLAQVLTNMILNSLVHAFEGIENGQIRIRVRAHNDTLTCTYQDNGNGMSQEHLDHLFDPFFTTRPNDGGSGLGTHIIRNILTQTLKGDITAHSAPGKGLRYDFHFPVAVLNT